MYEEVWAYVLLLPIQPSTLQAQEPAEGKKRIRFMENLSKQTASNKLFKSQYIKHQFKSQKQHITSGSKINKYFTITFHNEMRMVQCNA